MAGKTDIFGTPETAVGNSSGVFDSFFRPETAYISSMQKMRIICITFAKKFVVFLKDTVDKMK